MGLLDYRLAARQEIGIDRGIFGHTRKRIDPQPFIDEPLKLIARRAKLQEPLGLCANLVCLGKTPRFGGGKQSDIRRAPGEPERQ